VFVHAKKKVGDKYQKYIGFVNKNLQYKEGLLKMEFSDQKTYEGMILKGLQKTWVWPIGIIMLVSGKMT